MNKLNGPNVNGKKGKGNVLQLRQGGEGLVNWEIIPKIPRKTFIGSFILAPFLNNKRTGALRYIEKEPHKEE